MFTGLLHHTEGFPEPEKENFKYMNLYYHILLFFFIVIDPLDLRGQVNLIPNSSFENYSDCSTSPLMYSVNNWFLPDGEDRLIVLIPV